MIAITDHILMKRDLLARAGRVATLGRRTFGIAEHAFSTTTSTRSTDEAARARRDYDMLVIPGAEITQNRLRGKKNAHIIALDIKEYISADQSPDAILPEIRRAGRAEHRVSSASPHGAPARDQHVLPVGQPARARRPWWTSGRRPTATTCSR